MLFEIKFIFGEQSKKKKKKDFLIINILTALERRVLDAVEGAKKLDKAFLK